MIWHHVIWRYFYFIIDQRNAFTIRFYTVYTSFLSLSLFFFPPENTLEHSLEILSQLSKLVHWNFPLLWIQNHELLKVRGRSTKVRLDHKKKQTLNIQIETRNVCNMYLAIYNSTYKLWLIPKLPKPSCSVTGKAYTISKWFFIAKIQSG